jgi:hypothetical protein
MPSATAKFLANPTKFMASHLVQVEVNSLNPGPLTVRLETDTTKTCRTKLGKLVGKGTVPVCKLVPCNATADVFTIYWLPYKNNRVYHMQLGHQHPYLFTPTMDGCSFSIGGQDPVGAPLVAHANMQNDQHEIDQVAIEDQLDILYGNGSYGIMKKERYTGSKHFNVGSGHVRSTTFGVSDGTAWKFFAQVWEDDHKGVATKQALNDMDPSTPGYANAKWMQKYTRAANSFELLGLKQLKRRG